VIRFVGAGMSESAGLPDRKECLLGLCDDAGMSQDAMRERLEDQGHYELDAVRALQKVGFRVVRQGKHIVMSDGTLILTIPRHNPINAHTMGGIVHDAGLTSDEFKKLL